jgi:hypothetical protein
VSPVYKGGYGASGIEGVARDGEAVAFFSPGAFAGMPAGFSEGADLVAYLARRGGGGWSTVPLVPPDSLSAVVVGSADVSPMLGLEVAPVQLGVLEEPLPRENRAGFVLHRTDTPDLNAYWEVAGMVLEGSKLVPKYLGASADFCHLLFETGASAVLPGAKGVTNPIYELVRGCDGQQVELRLVAVNGAGKAISPLCLEGVGSENFGVGSSGTEFNAIAAGGNEIFFTTCIANDASHSQLFVRLGGVKTVEVSKLLGGGCGENEIPCKGAFERASAVFAGASEDGSRVFFTTTAPLSGEAKDTSSNLFMASIGCRESEPGCQLAEREVTSLVRVSRDPTVGEDAEVQGVVKVAPDGSRVYFVARGVLDEEPNTRGVMPVKGADNLYVYDAVSGKVAFVGDLCSGLELSGGGSSEGLEVGGVEDVHCPSKAADTFLWSGESEVQTAGADGRYLVFSTYAQLVANDTDAARDVYRYDARTGALDRVSAGEAGYHANGNYSEFDAMIAKHHRGQSVRDQYEMNNRTVSEDGSRVVFTTSEPLSPDAINGLANAYEWQEQPDGNGGSVSLISSGSAEAPVEDVVISPEGRDVFFATTQGLVQQDGDGAPDIYDARIGGGFPQAPAPRQQCSSDACQGPLTNPAPLLVPGSVSQVPGQNFAASTTRGTIKGKKKKVKAKRRGKKGKASVRHGSRGNGAAGRSGR